MDQELIALLTTSKLKYHTKKIPLKKIEFMFTRSPEFSNKINEVRKLPQGNEDENKFKKEQAKLLRMEAMLLNGHCAETIFQLFSQNPDITPQELKEHLIKEATIVHSLDVNFLVLALCNSKKRTTKIIRALEQLNLKDDLGKEFCKQKYNFEPAGKISLITDYPLALIMYVENPNDFNIIDSRKNVGGFFAYSSEFPKNMQEPEVAENFPLIVIFGEKPESTDITKPAYFTETQKLELHEKGHAEIKSFIIGNLLNKKIHRIWGRDIVEQKTINHLKKLAKEDINSIKTTPEWNNILEYALARAKNELLAEYKSQSGKSADYFNTLQNNPNYDYFLEIGLDPKSELYHKLWDEYTTILQSAVNMMEKIVRLYHRINLVPHDRIQSFRWVLAQTPIEKWVTILQIFVNESNRLNQVLDSFTNLKNQNHNATHLLAIIQLYSQFKNELSANSHKPWFQYIQNFEKRLQAYTPREQ